MNQRSLHYLPDRPVIFSAHNDHLQGPLFFTHSKSLSSSSSYQGPKIMVYNIPFFNPGLSILVHLCRHYIALLPSIISLIILQLFSPYSNNYNELYLRSIFRVSHLLLEYIDQLSFYHNHSLQSVIVWPISFSPTYASLLFHRHLL